MLFDGLTPEEDHLAHMDDEPMDLSDEVNPHGYLNTNFKRDIITYHPRKAETNPRRLLS